MTAPLRVRGVDPLDLLGQRLVETLTAAVIEHLDVRPLPDRLMTADEAADFCRCSREHLLRHARDGVIPGRKLGQLWVFSARALDEWAGGRDFVGQVGAAA